MLNALGEYKVIQVFDDRAAFDEWWDTESPKWRVADRHWNSGADTDFYRCVAKKPLVLVKYSLVQRPRLVSEPHTYKQLGKRGSRSLWVRNGVRNGKLRRCSCHTRP